MENSNNKVTVSLNYLKKAIDVTGATLVGKLLKRFEILDDKDAIRKEMKELIYEEFRALRNLLLTYSEGLEETRWEFKSKNNG